MLAALFSQFGAGIINGLLDTALKAFTAYENKQITREQLAEQLNEAMVKSVQAIEIAHADAIAKTFATFMGTVQQSRLMQIGWAVALFSQLFVLVWYQWVVPLLCYLEGNAHCYPSAGTTVDWAYFLVGGLVGLAPMVLRGGPGAGSMTDRLKAMVGK